MMRWIVGSSLKFQYLAVVLAAVVMAVGIVQLGNMPVDVLPEFSPPYVEIQTEALGLSAEEVEQLITVPMEQDLLNGVPWLDTIRSESVPGLSSIVLTFEHGTNLYRARQMVAERMTQAFALPHVSKTPTMLQPYSSTSRFMIIGLSSKDVSLIEMSVLSRWTIGPRLLAVPGVANVAIWGNRDRQLQVLVDPERLRAQGISLDQILATTGNALWVSSLSFLEASAPGTGGFIDAPQQRLGIRHLSPIVSAEGLAQVPVEGTTGLVLSDVAEVVEDHQPLIGDAIINDSPSLMLVVEKFPGSNTLEVTKGVEDALAAMQPGLPGIEFDTSIYRPATFIESAIGNLSGTLLVGALLIALVLFIFLYDWRTALISFMAISLSLMAAVFLLQQRGATMNVMVLAGLAIAIGAVIDDAIVDVENIARRLRQHREEVGNIPNEVRASTLAIALQASLEMRSALVFATLFIILPMLLILFQGGVSGAFFQPLALSYTLAVLASMLVALTVTPALSLVFLSNARLRRRSPLLGWLQRGYDRVLARIVQKPRPVFLTLAVIMLIGLAVLPFLSQSLLPSFKERDLLIQLNGAPGSSRPEMDRIVARVSTELRAIPGVQNVGAHVGRAVFGDQVVGINSATLWVSVDPQAGYDATVAAIRETVNGYPGLQHNVQTYLQETSSEAMARPDDSIVVRVYGQDLGVLRSQAEKVKQTLTGIDGIVASEVKFPIEEPTFQIKVDLAKARNYGIKPGDVRRAAATLLSGLQVGSLFEEQKVFEVVVWSTPETRQSLTDIRELLIDTPGGGHVRLGDVAEVRVAAVPNVIKHEAVSRYLDVSANVHGRDFGSVARDIEHRIQGLEFPLEYHAEVLGEHAEQQAAQERILIAGIVTLIGIFLLLQAASGNWRLATLTFLTLPAALVGGLMAAYFGGGGVITLGSLAGLFTVLGIAVRGGILLTSHYQHLEQKEGQAFSPELILRGARERVAPILMTALTTGSAFLPFVVLGNIPGQEMIYPMAIVVLGGLVTSTLLNLFVMPALYLRFGASREADLELHPVPAAA